MNNTLRSALAAGLSLAATLLLLPDACLGAPLPSPTPSYSLPVPTKTAITAPSPTPVPTATNFGFENPSGWTMSGSAAIITLSGAQAPDGTHVASLSGSNAIISGTIASLPSTTWRLHFSAAQKTSSDTQTLRVTVGGTNVVALGEASGTTFEEITTRPFTASGSTEIRFEGVTAGETVLIDNIHAEQVYLWTSTSTWGGAVPTSTDDVSIPPEARVALSGSCAAATVNVAGALLVSNTTSSLTARWVMVSGSNSVFEVGTEGCPFLQNFTLTLTGTLGATENIMGAGSKFLMAMGGGLIDLHGKPHNIDFGGQPQRSWVNLNSNALPNVTTIRTNPVVDWASGTAVDTIVIAPSTLPVKTRSSSTVTNTVDAIEAEVRTININDGTGILTLGAAQMPNGTLTTGTLQYAHLGSVYSSTRPQTVIPATSSTLPLRIWKVDERAEVGLLTHNVVVQGDASSEATQFGGHVMIMKMTGTGCAACGANGGGIGHFSNVEFYRMGQKQRIGRYPIHWHMLGDEGDGQYAINCSIWHSYNRAITIHGTSKLEIVGNVAYDHIGHGIFLEDGSETDNIIEYNLALGSIRPADGEDLLPTDNASDGFKKSSPATYWITNPNNIFIGNVAAGTIGNGFWFALPQTPLGQSGTNARFQSIKPIEEPLGTFQANVAHSNQVGISTNDSIDPTNKTLIGNVAWNPYPDVPNYVASLKDFTCYANITGIYAGVGNHKIHYDGAMLADNQYQFFTAAYQTVENSLLVADTKNHLLNFPSGLGGSSAGGELYAYVIYDGPGRMKNCHLVGYGEGNTNNASFFNMRGGASRHANHIFEGLTFDVRPAFDLTYAIIPIEDSRSWAASLYDKDGTLTGIGAGNVTLTSAHKMMRTDTNVPPSGWTNAYPTTSRFAQVVLQYPGGVITKDQNFPTATISRVNYTTGTAMPAASYTYKQVDTVQPHAAHQLHLITNTSYSGSSYNYVRYDWQFTAAEASPTQNGGWPNEAKCIEVNVKDLLSSQESILIRIINLGKLQGAGGLNLTWYNTSTTTPTWQPLTSQSLTTLMSSNTTGYCCNNVDVYLLIKGSIAENGCISSDRIRINWTGTFNPK